MSAPDEDGCAESSRLNYRVRSFQQARSSIDSGETRGICRFLESWTAYRKRTADFLPVACTFATCPSAPFSSVLSSLLLPACFPPPHVARYVNVILPKPLPPRSPIRATSPARFFVSERMSRLIDEWRTYTLSLLNEPRVLTCVRGVRSNVLPCLIIRWTPRYFDGSR